MGFRYAVANGNWSNTATWDQSTLPIAGDVVTANNFNVTVDTDINVATLSTLANLNPGVTQTMTSNTTPTGFVVAASSVAGSGPAWHAFDRNLSTGWLSSGIVSGVNPEWIYIQLPIARIVNRYTFYTTSVVGRVPNNWTFEGSNNGSTWTVIQTVVGGSPGVNAYYISPLLGNTTAYLYYRLNISATVSAANAVQIMEISLLDTSYTTISGSSGGGFNATGSRIITLTSNDLALTGSAIVTGTTSTFTHSGSLGTTLTLNAGVGQFIRSTTNAVNCITIAGGGTANITGIISTAAASIGNSGVSITGTGSVVTFTGNIFGGGSTSRGITTNVSCTLTVIGNVESGTGNDGYGIVFSGGTINITGNLTMNNSAANRCSALFNGGTAYVTGNITGWGGTGAASSCPTVQISPLTAAIYVTGTVTGGSNVNNATADAIRVGNASAGTANPGYVNIVGPVVGGYISPALISQTLGSINLLSGPFICSNYGTFPLSVQRMHYIKTATSYFEFRDSSTNGALPPGSVAPTASMFDPSKIVDAPTVNNVRSGISYALGSQTGTLVVPSSSSVAAGVTFDNGTVGTAVLTAAAVTNAIWNQLVTDLTGSNSIGARVANCSTVSTTGAQIASLT